MFATRLSLLLGAVLLAAGCHSVHRQPCAPECAQPVAKPCGWEGIYPTVLTPWQCGSVDHASLAAQIEYQLSGGVNGLLLLGTIGEGEYANMEERAEVIQVAVQSAAGCVPIVAGIHTCDLEVAKAQLLQAQQLGVCAVLIKYIGNPHAEFCDVFAFFKQLSVLEVLPIFYYHYPSQTGLCLKPEEIAKILLLPGVAGIKESTLNLGEVERHITLTRGHGRIFLSGTAVNLTQFMALGGHGAMCPEAALLPGLTVHAYRAYTLGDVKEARSTQRKLFVVVPLLQGGFITEPMARCLTMAAQDRKIELPMGEDHPQARLKAALDGLAVPTSPEVKPPLPPLSRQDEHKVNGFLRKANQPGWFVD